MENFIRISTGRIAQPFKSSVFNSLLTTLRSKQVMVPAKWSVEEIIFEFRARFERIIDPKLPEASFMEATGLLIDMWEAAAWRTEVGPKAKKGFRDEKIDKIKSILNVERDQVEFLGQELERSFAANLAGSLVTPSLIKDLLSDKRYHVDNFPRITMSDAFDVRDLALELHALFSESAPWSEIQSFVQNRVATNPLVQATHQLILTFRNTDGLCVPMRLDFVVDTILSDLGRKPFFETAPLKGMPLFKRVTNVTVPDAGFKELLSFYFAYLRRYMGGPSDQTVSLNFAYLSDVLERGQLTWPALPKEALSKYENLLTFYDQMVVFFLTQQAALGQFGSLRGLFTNFISDKKYKNDDAYIPFVNKWIDALCLFTDACDQTANFFYNRGMDANLYYDDMSQRSISLIRDFVLKYVQSLTSLSLVTDHPRYLLQPALLINGAKSSDGAFQLNADHSDPSYFFLDEEYKKLDAYVINPTDFSFVSYRRSDHISGLLFEAPIGELDKRVLFPPLCSRISATYFRSFPLTSDFANLPAIDFRLRHRNLKSITDNGLLHLLRGSMEIDVFTDALEFAQAAHIPLELAKELVPSRETPIAAFSGPLLEYYLWDDEIAPVYEIEDSRTEDGRYKPFVAKYPFFLKSEQGQVAMSSSMTSYINAFRASVPQNDSSTTIGKAPSKTSNEPADSSNNARAIRREEREQSPDATNIDAANNF